MGAPTVSTSAPKPVEEDSRGILDPWLLRRRVRLNRYPATPVLDGLIDRFWAVQWDLPEESQHRQQLLTHPGANLSVGHGEAAGPGVAGPLEARLNGVARGITTRTLAGRGWTVAAMTTPGGLGAFLTGPATVFNDRVLPLTEILDLDEAQLIREVGDRPDEPARVGVLAAALEKAVAGADPHRVRQARDVADVAKLAESDRTLRRLDDLGRAAGVAPRTLQRMFLHCAGVSPTWMLRRYRLLNAAEEVRDGRPVSWATVAAQLGYADQAHLARDFRSATGQTPGAYARSQRG